VVGPAFLVLMVGSAFLGASAGALDATLNAYVSVHLEHRVLAYMHGGFGLGATLGPIAVITILNAGWSWRVAYGVLAAWQVGLAATWWSLRHRFVSAPAVASGPDESQHASRVVAFEGDIAEAPAGVPARSRRRSVAWLNVMMFFLYTGAEGSTGFLVATLLIERGLSTQVAGALTTAYWLSLTVGRFGTGAIGSRLTPPNALLIGSAGLVVGAALVALGGTVLAGPGLVVLGLSLAPFFPSLVALTPARVGTDRAAGAIGRQLAAASLGVATVPSLISLIAQHQGRAAIAPGLFVAAVLLAGGHLLTGAVAGDLRVSDPART
jgi:fucose permease